MEGPILHGGLVTPSRVGAHFQNNTSKNSHLSCSEQAYTVATQMIGILSEAEISLFLCFNKYIVVKISQIFGMNSLNSVNRCKNEGFSKSVKIGFSMIFF